MEGDTSVYSGCSVMAKSKSKKKAELSLTDHADGG